MRDTASAGEILDQSLETEMLSAAPAFGKEEEPWHFEYETVGGVFMQSESETDDGKFDFKKLNFGLIEREYPIPPSISSSISGKDEPEPSSHGTTIPAENEGARTQWVKLNKYVEYLNEQSDEKTTYKVLFLGRHGQGWHNLAEEKYGTKDWDCYWSLLDGANGLNWSDSLLTPLGESQALAVHALWSSLRPQDPDFPSPSTYYLSPLSRTIQTADLTFQTLALPDDKPYKPIVKELLRETIGLHTCDRRSPLSHILASFPHLTPSSFPPFPPYSSYPEHDTLFTPSLREPNSARRKRLTALLDDIFATDTGTFLSLTAHSGAITSLLEAVQHRKFALETGGVIPVLVKARKVHGKRDDGEDEEWEGKPECDGDPRDRVLE